MAVPRDGCCTDDTAAPAICKSGASGQGVGGAESAAGFAGNDAVQAGLDGAGDLKVVLEVRAGHRLGGEQSSAVRCGDLDAEADVHRSLGRGEVCLLTDNVENRRH